ncbi:MAG: LysR family transcriptional regulator [Alphaproteobacteria bacterium]
MDRLDMMRVFVAVAEQAGFSAAARTLGLSAPAVTRAVAALEDRLGGRLMQRTTRRVRLTEAGARYLADCRRILAAVDEAEASATGAHGAPRGLLSVTAPVLLEFLARYPEASARCLYVDRVVDLLDEGFDVAVRIARLPDSTMTAVRVGAVRRVVCAAPALLARHGTPQRPADLRELPSINFSPGLTELDWSFGPAPAERVRPPTRLTVNAGDVAIAAAVSGEGIIRVLSYQVAGEIADGRLVAVLEAHEPPPVPIHLVHADGRRASARVRVFVDHAAAALRARLANVSG